MDKDKLSGAGGGLPPTGRYSTFSPSASSAMQQHQTTSAFEVGESSSGGLGAPIAAAHLGETSERPRARH